MSVTNLKYGADFSACQNLRLYSIVLDPGYNLQLLAETMLYKQF